MNSCWNEGDCAHTLYLTLGSLTLHDTKRLFFHEEKEKDTFSRVDCLNEFKDILKIKFFLNGAQGEPLPCWSPHVSFASDENYTCIVSCGQRQFSLKNHLAASTVKSVIHRYHIISMLIYGLVKKPPGF